MYPGLVTFMPGFCAAGSAGNASPVGLGLAPVATGLVDVDCDGAGKGRGVEGLDDDDDDDDGAIQGGARVAPGSGPFAAADAGKPGNAVPCFAPPALAPAVLALMVDAEPQLPCLLTALLLDCAVELLSFSILFPPLPRLTFPIPVPPAGRPLGPGRLG